MGSEPAEPGTDRALLEALAEGDPAALRALYDRHAPWLVLRLERRCSDRSIVEDVVQDTFIAIWRKPSGYRGSGDVAAWIWGIGIRRLIDRLRRQRLRAGVAVEAGPDEPSAEDRMLLGIEHGDLASALNRLSPELRAVLQATALDGLTTREAAALLGIPQGTVKTRLMRARAELRKGLA
ncbi:MAG TPA: RNA polymerase sigma factor [Actinomycetota bacterium]